MKTLLRWWVVCALLLLGDRAMASRVDLEVGAFTATTERFALCSGYHPGDSLELDLCLNADRDLLSAGSHLFYRSHWRLSRFTVGVGPGVGVGAMLLCPYGTCAAAVGPKLLASAEAVWWVTPSVGLTLQADAGLWITWLQAAPGLIQHSVRFPARLLAGVTF
jgi:hypothetical protein